MPRLPVIDAHKLIAALERVGFVITRHKGSHVRLKHPDGRVVTVPVHAGKDIGRGLLGKILRDVEWTVEDLLTYLEKE
jgi:predicted RNA binding protein YcfA (HicA-like mRNA interferase family)